MVGWEEDKRRNIMESTKQHTGDFLWLDGNYLLMKIESDDSITFKIYDTKHSIFPKGDYVEDGFSSFKKLGTYSFEFNDLGNLYFDEFVKSLVVKNIVRDASLYSDFLSISTPKIKNPYDYKFLKLHLSSSSTIAQRKREEFIQDLEGKTFYKSNNKVYIDDWVHVFLGVDKPYNLDGLKINEVEYDTSIILNCYSSDKNIQNSWDSIKAGLMAVRH